MDAKDAFTASANYGRNIWKFLGIPRQIRNQTVLTLPGGYLAIILFRWNSTGVAKGNYTISAYAWPVLSETDLVDNSLVDGSIAVAMIGDITGPTSGVPDGKVEIRDIALVAAGFGVDVGAEILAPGPGSSTWLQYWHPEPYCYTCPLCPHDPNCDLTGEGIGVPDGKIAIIDVATVAIRFGQEDP